MADEPLDASPPPATPAAASASTATITTSRAAATESRPINSTPIWRIARAGRNSLPRSFSTGPA
jgi:hypothetical protein